MPQTTTTTTTTTFALQITAAIQHNYNCHYTATTSDQAKMCAGTSCRIILRGTD
jgi:hypothetical protein